MKALYLLLGLLLLTTISSAPPTTFLIGGWVIDSDGDPVNDPNVIITNLNTSEVFTAETIANYYQYMPENISAGDVLEFNTTDGTRSNITKHDVVAEEIGDETFFQFNITLAEAALTPTPQIIGYNPDSPVHDIRNATRTFNITIDQVVDVTWLINGTEVFNEAHVNESSYTNTSADIGVRNVSALVSNGNGTVMQEWVWNVTTMLPPNITAFTPQSPVYDTRNATRTFNITVDQVVNVTWLINGLQAQTNGSVTDASYTNTSADIGIWNVSAIVSNGNGTVMQEWVWNVTTLLPPNITAFTPTSPVYDTRNATRTFNITVDQVVDVIWLINGLLAQTNQSVTDASYTNYSADIGVWNVSAKVSNGNGTVMQEWVWNVTTLLPPNITSFAPQSPVYDTKNATTTFNIAVDQVVNVTWQIDGTEVFSEAYVNESSYTNTSAAIGVRNVSAIASNENGTAMQEWVWNVTTLLPPNITSFAPPSPVYDTKNATTTFNITVDQVVNVTWLINGTKVLNETDVNESSYTNTSADIGVRNVSAIASNRNGTAMQEWVWNVTTLLPPNITAFTPQSPVHDTRNTTAFNTTVDQAVNVTWLINGAEVLNETDVNKFSYTNTSADTGVWTENATQTFGIIVDQVVNVTWLINGTKVFNETDVNESSYTNTSAATGVRNVSAIASNENGTAMQKWVWNVTTLLPPNITAFTPPPPPVYDTVNKTRTFGITIDQVVNVTWLINGTEVFNEANVDESSYINTSAAIGVWNVTAIVSNLNGTDKQEWIWKVTSHAPTLSPVFVIYGNVSYDNGSTCNSPFVVITNLNTSEELIADNHTGEAFYQLVTNSTFVNEGDELRINAHKNTMPVGNAIHTVKEADIRNGVIKVDINERYLPDFTVTNLTFDLPDPRIGDIVKINATIANNGAAEEMVFVEFCDNKSITIERISKDYPESPNNDTITLPDAKRMRVHFESFGVSSVDNIGNITIYNETQSVEWLNGTGTNHWTKWCDGGTIRIKSWNAGFTVDRYEAVLEDGHRSLGAGNSTNIPVLWNLSDQSMGWAVHGSHNITVRADPYNEIVESDETNNDRIEVIYVNPSLDFTVTGISLNTSEPVLGDVVGITANISNYGVRNETTYVGVYYDNRSIDINRTLSEAGSNSTDIISLPPGVLGARLHLEHVKIRDGEVAIYDGSGRMVEHITHSGKGTYIVRNDEWTDWMYGENITIGIELIPQQYGVKPLGFSINLTWEDELNNGTIPEVLKDQLEPWGLSLSYNATVEKKGEDEWIIIEGGMKKYCIRKESDELDVYYYDYSGHIYEGSFRIDEYEALIAEKPVTLNATESKIINASWRTGAVYGGARDHNITVVVDPRNHSIETNETNNMGRSEEIFVNGTDLTVTGIKILHDLCYVGQDVNINATIANIGAVDATNFTVEFLDGSCEYCSDMNTSGVIFNETHIKRLNSGENMTIPVIWNPADINYHTITARIPYDAVDNNETNNELSDCSDVEARYDFFVESVNVDPQTAQKGDSVNITATVGNTGSGGGNVSIAFFVNSTDFAGTLGERFTKIGTNDSVYLELNKTENVSIRWDVDVVGGYHMIAAVINPENELEEVGGTRYLHDTIQFRGRTGNNVKNCTLHIKPLDLDITNLTLVPAEPNIGDIVNVTAEIKNKGSAEVNSMAWFYMEKNESIPLSVRGNRHDSCSISQPGDVQIRVHFDYIRMIMREGNISASVTDSQGDSQSVRFYVKCEEYGQDVNVSGIASTTKFVTNCYEDIVVSEPWDEVNYRCWDDVWTEWTCGSTLKISAASHGGGVELLIDKYQVRLGNETVTLGPGESRFYHSSWNASPPLTAGENYTLMAIVEDDVEKKDAYLGGTDLTMTNLTIKNISVKPVVWDGEAVWINATIENLGRMDATGFSVGFTEVYYPTYGTHPETGRRIDSKNTSDHTIGRKYLDALDAGNSTNISVLWNASIREIECNGGCKRKVTPDTDPCSWIEIADNYTIKVEINLDENLDLEEDNGTNHSLERNVHVDNSCDFNVTNLSFFVNGTVCDPLELDFFNDVVLNATVNITNLINRSGSVNVSFYFDEIEKEHEIGSCSITFDVGNKTEYAQIEWTDMRSPGEHNIIVVADPEEEIYEIDETNNNLTQEISLNAPELVLESLNVLPNNPKRGETVKINVTIANKGERNASNVNLTIYDWSQRHIEDDSNRSGPGRKIIKIPNETKENVTAMRLYLDLNVENGSRVCINDSSGSEIICYHEIFHGWTPWILDNSTTIIVTNNETDSTYVKVSKVYYLMPESIIDTSIHSLGINETKNITVSWNTSVVGERLITAIVDPEDCVAEYNESNNRLAEFISVQTADIEVSNLSLLLNSTKIGKNDTIKYGDNVNITADIANIGVDDAGNFSVRFLIDDILIKEKTIPDLAEGSAIRLSADWNATVGYNLIKVEADFKNEINETNETNNIAALYPYICGAELSGNISWVTSGLNNVLLFPENPTQPYDEDEVNITVDIRNSGCAPATNFNAALLFDYTPDYFSKKCMQGNSGVKWINKTYPDAEYIYLKVNTPVYIHGVCRCMVKDDVIVYDVNDSEVARPGKSCWVMVKGNTTNILITTEGYSWYPVFDIYFYPIYQNETSMLYKDINVSVNSSYNLFSMNRNVSAGNFTIMVMVDPEHEVPEDEDNREDNFIYKTMHVKPTRDFTVTNVIAANTSLSDFDRIKITAGVSNTGLRNGTVEVNVVDYEEENRTYKYHFDRSLDQSYLPIAPNATLSGIQFEFGLRKLQYYEELTIIHRPGVDAIKLHFDKITLKAPVPFGKSKGRIEVCNETGARKWYNESQSDPGDTILYNPDVTLVPGETVYICTYNADFELGGYTTEREFHRENITLNATKTWNESKNIISTWNAYTGDHSINVTLDVDDRISEISESNNELGSVFHVNTSRDPAIIELNITPEHPEDGEPVYISATITNNGSENASFTFDLWANTTRNEDGSEDVPLRNPNLITDFGDRTRYIKLLKHADITTLAPGENVTVNSTWNDISVFGSPTHRIIAIVDPLDEIDEINERYLFSWEKVPGNDSKRLIEFLMRNFNIEWIKEAEINKTDGKTINITNDKNFLLLTLNIEKNNVNLKIDDGRTDKFIVKMKKGELNIYNVSNYESNNEIEREIIMAYPDLTIGRSYVPGGKGEVVVNIEEIGDISGADGVTVRFESYETVEYNKESGNIHHPDAFNMQVHFDHIDARGKNSYVEVGGKRYKGELSDVLSPWVEGDTIRITRRGSGTWFDISEYRWGNVSDEQIDDYLPKGKTKYVKMPWTDYREPYDLTITVDPDNNITELNEDNNNKTIEMGADIAVNRYVNVDPYAPIMGDTCNIRNIENIGNLHTGEFNVTLYINATNEVAFEHNITINETISLAPNEEYLFAWKTPEVEPPDDIDYDIRIVADTEDVVKELKEDNNEGSGDITVYSHSNYTGGKLYLYKTDWVYGGINYTIGDSIYIGSTWDDYVANYEDVIPENINEDDIKLARLYLYWTWGKALSINESKYVPVPIEVDVEFNGEGISEDRRYLDYPHATDFDVSWGTYTYEIPPNAVKSNNSVVVDRNPFKKKYESDQYYSSPQPFGIYGVGLLVIYEDEDGVLTNYWINEGGDVIFEGANALGIEDMVTTALFEGKVEDEDMANATLWTVTPGGNDENVLYFNDMGWGNVWSGEIGIDHRCVTEHLITKDNTARLQYISGNSMMSSGAFLLIRYPPDLAVTDIDTPVSAVIGKEYTINTTISNEGRSDATDFNVSFYSDTVRIGGEKISRLDSGDNITLQFNWTPMGMGDIYNIKVVADVVSGQDWIETDTDNNEKTERVPIVPSGFGNESGPIGEGGSGTGGSGTGTEGSGDGEDVSLFDTITGILMKGSVLKDGEGGGGGGGIGEFSLLEWLLKGLILAICSLLIFFGFLMEKRRHNMR